MAKEKHAGRLDLDPAVAGLGPQVVESPSATVADHVARAGARCAGLSSTEVGGL
jgi:hypothetical protein